MEICAKLALCHYSYHNSINTASSKRFWSTEFVKKNFFFLDFTTHSGISFTMWWFYGAILSTAHCNSRKNVLAATRFHFFLSLNSKTFCDRVYRQWQLVYRQWQLVYPSSCRYSLCQKYTGYCVPSPMCRRAVWYGCRGAPDTLEF